MSCDMGLRPYYQRHYMKEIDFTSQNKQFHSNVH